jgi:GNAT superfamily N-acetyltransferase
VERLFTPVSERDETVARDHLVDLRSKPESGETECIRTLYVTQTIDLESYLTLLEREVRTVQGQSLKSRHSLLGLARRIQVMNGDEDNEAMLAIEYAIYRGVGPIDEGDDYLVHLEGTIMGHGDSGKSSTKIGTIQVILIKVGECINDKFPLHTMFDVQQETLDAGNAVYDLSADEYEYTPSVVRMFPDAMPFNDILLIKRMEIEPSFRGKKIGLAVLYQAIKDWSSGCSLVLIKPFPLQFEVSNLKKEMERDLGAEKAATKKLKNYYQTLGFESIPKTPFLAMCPVQRYPTFEELGLPKYITLTPETKPS